MGIREDIEALKKRKAKALEMGGADKTDIVYARGSYTARERIAKLLDVDTFTEVGLLAHSDLAGMEEKTAADGKICGFGEIDWRTVAVCANDVSVLAGSGGRIGHKKSDYLSRMAVKNGYPIVNLGEAGGARIPGIQGSDGMSSMTITTKTSMRKRQVPLVATIMGECFWGPVLGGGGRRFRGSGQRVVHGRIRPARTGHRHQRKNHQRGAGWLGASRHRNRPG